MSADINVSVGNLGVYQVVFLLPQLIIKQQEIL